MLLCKRDRLTKFENRVTLFNSLISIFLLSDTVLVYKVGVVDVVYVCVSFVISITF